MNSDASPAGPAAAPNANRPAATSVSAALGGPGQSAAPPGSSPGPRPTPDFKAHRYWNSIIQWLAPLSIVGLIFLVVWVPSPSAGGPVQIAVTVAVITGAAVAVERFIEGFWNLLASNIGMYWPMTSIGQQVHALENELAEAMQPFHDQLHTSLSQVQQVVAQGPSYLDAAQRDMQRMKARFDDIRAHAPSNQRMQLLAASAAQSVNFLVTKYGEHLPALRAGTALADTAIGGMQDFLATFKDNPGRRLLSLYLGALLGLLLAWVFQLDVFAAVASAPAAPGPAGGFLPAAAAAAPGLAAHDPALLHFASVVVPDTLGAAARQLHRAGALPVPPLAGLRLAATGLLIGFGSNPTHEVIQALQEYKKGRKGDNTSKPKLSSKHLRPVANPLAATPAPPA